MGKQIRYCTCCVMPETKPDLHLDAEGVCSACRYFQQRQAIDYDARERELVTILDRYRCKDGTNYDCIIPVSGGKDSHVQVIKMLEHGMNPLCVTASTDMLSGIGRDNIENIKNLGVDYVEMSVNPLVRRKINRLALTQVGDISWPEHVAIFTIPIHFAVKFKVPLIVWGENSQNEYGGPAAASQNHVLTRRWLEEFGGLLGLRVSDLMQESDIEPRHLIQYIYPQDDELQRVGVTGIFLGYFIPWDGYANALLAQAHGFTTYHKTVEGSIVNYENLDNHQTGIHDYFKFLKFAFGRATDIACLHIRRGRLTRKQGVNLVKRHDGKFPWEYLGKSLEDILAPLEMTVEEFVRICDRFTNKKLFVLDANGRLVKDKHGNLTRINDDNHESSPAAENPGPRR